MELFFGEDGIYRIYNCQYFYLLTVFVAIHTAHLYLWFLDVISLYINIPSDELVKIAYFAIY